MDATGVLTVVFDRPYTPRNQLVHGGVTCNGSVNRSRVRDGNRIMAHLVPTIIRPMRNNPGPLWGDAVYPVVPRSDPAGRPIPPRGSRDEPPQDRQCRHWNCPTGRRPRCP